jgi:iron complex transport system permease protein
MAFPVDLHRETIPVPHRASGDRSQVARLTLVILASALILLCPLALSTGASDVGFADAFAYMADLVTASAHEGRNSIILFDIRMPRIVLGMLIGAALAVSGVVLQGLFRNPLADPGIIGVSAGASVGAVGVIILGNTLLLPLSLWLGAYMLPVAAFCGSLISTMLLYTIATRHGRTSMATMLLAGIALGALAGALTGLMIYIADDRQLRDITFWGLGSLSGATWMKIGSAGPLIAAGIAGSFYVSKALNALLLGEAEARHLGHDVQALKRIAILSVSAATGASVAVSGGIGFIGVVVPHLLRLLIGPDNRYLMPASAMLGAITLVLADMISRTLVSPAELPIGIVTAVIGAPFFLWLLLRRKGMID